jgi:hypothetical protein
MKKEDEERLVVIAEEINDSLKGINENLEEIAQALKIIGNTLKDKNTF